MRFWPWCHLWHLIVLQLSEVFTTLFQMYVECGQTPSWQNPAGFHFSHWFSSGLGPLPRFSSCDGCRTFLMKAAIFWSSLMTPTCCLFRWGPQSDRALISFLKWCNDNSFDLNLSKTKELINVLRKICVEPKASIKHDEDVQIVDLYTYLGTVWNLNSSLMQTEPMSSRDNNKKLCLREYIMYFYLTFLFICLFNGLSVKRTVKMSVYSKIIEVQ